METQAEPQVADAMATFADGWAALVEAQKAFSPLVKDKVNPHFRNKYASEEAVYKAVKPALLARGIVLIHTPFVADGFAYMRTKLVYKGEVLDEAVSPVGVATMPQQQVASAKTYSKRYNTCDLLALAAEDDDDGEAATASRGKAASADAPF